MSEDLSSRRIRRGFGVAGAVPHDLISAIAAEAEKLGFDSFWVNDTPNGDGLSALVAAAGSTSRIALGVGVLPVDRWPAATIATRVDELKLPQGRLFLGIGSGGLTVGAVDAVEAAAIELERRTAARVLVGALGPRMCEAGGAHAGGVLLNWITAQHAASSAKSVAEAAARRGRRTFVSVYVRVALPGTGAERTEAEAERYASYPAYAAHFRRMGVRAIDTCVVGSRPEIAEKLERFHGIDEVIVRAIAADESLAGYRALLEATRP
jgi:alkanesulfonate monooxygenase SsuD/methylene tetrahydromethanopterin reductase-like flavin-dependent oxidoreductase (luciferase family)